MTSELIFARRKTSGATHTLIVRTLAMLALLIGVLAGALPAQAADGDFSIDFAAAAPQSYNHLIGGGAYDDRTIGVDKDVVESLEGGDFRCGDIVTYFVAVTVDNTSQAQTDAPQTIEIDFAFLADTTGQSGVALGDIVSVGVNYGTIQDLIAGENTVDDGISDDGGSVATLISESLTGPLFQSGSELLGTVQLTDLERNEKVVVRIDVKLFCDPGSGPTGNLQADLSAARLTFINGNTPTTASISAGNQTIPFKQIENITFPGINVVKTVTTAAGTCPSTDSLTVNLGATVKYCYVVTNPSNVTDPPGAPLYNVTLIDDNGTPANTADDFAVTLTGLTDQDADGVADDLAGGGTATGSALVTMPNSTATVINTATATGDDAIINPTAYTDTDTATVNVTFVATPSIDVEKYISGTTWLDADTAPGPYLPAGSDPQFKFVVTNNGNVPLTSIGLIDSDFDLTSCTVPSSLAVNASFECIITAPWVAGQHSNTATASGSNHGTTVNNTDDAHYFGSDPELTLVKKALPITYSAVGAVINYSYTLSNTGNVTLHAPFTVTDDKTTVTCPLTPTSLAPGESITCTATYIITQADLDNGSVTNIATATAKDLQNNTVTSNQDQETVNAITNPVLTIDKTGDAGPVTIGSMVHYTITVTNTGNVTLNNVTVTDAKLGLNQNLGTLTVGQSKFVTGSYGPVTEADLPGPIFNTAGAVGTTPINTPVGPVTDTHTVPVSVNPGLVIIKTGDAGPVTIGDTVHYTITVQNTGNVTLNNVTVTDAKLGLNQNVGVLSAGQSKVLTGSYGPVTESDLPGPIFNIAGATGTTPTNTTIGPVTDTHEVPLSINPALEIEKTGDAGPVTIGSTVHYTITVRNTGNVTLHNVTVTDAKLGLSQNVGTLTVGQSKFVTGSYGPVTEADLPGPIFNNAIVTGTTPIDTPVGPVTDTHTVPVSIAPALTLDKVAEIVTFNAVGDVITYTYKLTNNGNVPLHAPFTVTDDKTTVTCPNTSANLAPGESITCIAIYAVTPADLEAESVTNLARAKAKDPQNNDVISNEDQETVTLTIAPTAEKETEQPKGPQFMYLPTVQAEE